MAMAIYISGILAGLIFKKSKICTAYIFGIMYIFAAFRTYDPDYYTYKIGFQTLGNSTLYRYKGYYLFQKIFYNFGLSFEQYNYVFYFFIFVVFFISIKLLTDNINWVLSCYMIHSYAVDVIQMKSYIAEVLILISIAIAFKNLTNRLDGINRNDILDWGVAIICSIIAINMHFSTLFYLFAIMIYLLVKNRENMSKRIFFITILFFAILFSGGLIAVMRYANALGIISDMEYLRQWTGKAMHFGFLIYYGIVILVVFSCHYNKEEIVFDSEQKIICEFILTLMLVMPFLYLNGNYSRLLRIYMILVYILYARMPRKRMITLKKSVNLIMYYLSIFLLYYMDIGANFSETLGALLKYNALIH